MGDSTPELRPDDPRDEDPPVTEPEGPPASTPVGQPGEPGGLFGEAVAGVAWTTAQTWAVRVTGMVTVAVLARLLTPADFGVVAMAMALPPVLQLFADMGLSTYILQADRPTRRTYNTFFWYSAIAGVLLSAVLLAAAPLVGAVLGSPEVVPISAAISPVALLVVLSAVPITILRRDMKFRVIAVQSVVTQAAGQVVALTLAFTGFGVWALVWQILTAQTVGLVLAWIAARFRPRLEFSRAEFVVMTRFGVKVAGTQVLGAGAIWLVNAIIVGALGTTWLGYLNIAQRLTNLAQELVTAALWPVSTVTFSRLRGSLGRLRSAYLRALSTSYALAAPIMVFVAVGAAQIVAILFGDQWTAAVPVAQLLALACLASSMAGLENALFVAMEKPGTWFVYFVIVDIVTVAVAWLTASHGLYVYAVGFLIVGVAAAVVRWLMVAKLLQAPWWRIAEPQARIWLPLAAAAGVGIGIGQLVRDWGPFPALVVIWIGGVAVYLPLVRLASPTAWGELTRVLRAGLRRVARRAPASEER